MMKSLLTLILALLFGQVYSQEVSLKRVTVEKDDSYPRFEVAMIVKTDLDGFTSMLDDESTTFKSIADNTGYDMLAGQMKYEKEKNSSNSYYDPLKMTFFGNNAANDGFEVNFRLGTLPSKGATSVSVAGTIGMVMEGGNEKTVKLKSIPMNGEEVDTELGKIRITEGGSISTDEETFLVYAIDSKMPIYSTTVSGDDTKMVKEKFGMGINGNEFVFKTAPEKVDIEVTYKEVKIKEVPFETTVTLGF